ncbi:hypothetical protein D3C76_539650 [compost metagenome]
MIQMYTMIFWGKAREEDFDYTSKKIFDILQCIVEGDIGIDSFYLTASTKRNTSQLELNYNSITEILKKGVNKEGKTIMPELGYSIGLFSSLDEEKSASITITVGITNPKFYNILIVQLPFSLQLMEDVLTMEKVSLLFKKVINTFDPFWAALVNKPNTRRFDGHMNDHLPTAVHWLNYWGKDIVELVGVESIENSPLYAKEKIKEGYFLKLKQTVIDDTCDQDIMLQREANEYFKLLK